MLTFGIGRTPQRLILDDSVIEHFRMHQQKRWYQKEAGGQLFAAISDSTIRVIEATGPRKTDKRSRSSYVADRRAERVEIRDRFGKGLHYVGDWHTHPQRIPQPSPLDVESIRECVRKSVHALNAFVLIVVGCAEFPDGLHVLIHDGRDAVSLTIDEAG